MVGGAVVVGVLVAGGVAGVQFANASTTPKAASAAAVKEQAAKDAAAAKARTLLAAAQNDEISCNIVAVDAVAAKEIKLSKRESARQLQKENLQLAGKLAKELAKADHIAPAKSKAAAKEAARAAALLNAARIKLLVSCLDFADVEVAIGKSVVTTPPSAAPTATVSASVTSSPTATSSATRHF